MFACTLKAALRVGVASPAYLFVLGFTFCEGFDPEPSAVVHEIPFSPTHFQLGPGVQNLYWKFRWLAYKNQQIYEDECLYKNLIILILPPQSCQKNKL